MNDDIEVSGQLMGPRNVAYGDNVSVIVHEYICDECCQKIDKTGYCVTLSGPRSLSCNYCGNKHEVTTSYRMWDKGQLSEVAKLAQETTLAAANLGPELIDELYSMFLKSSKNQDVEWTEVKLMIIKVLLDIGLREDP